MIILEALYFMLPAYFANMAPVFATKIFGNRFSLPIDFGKKIGGRPLLGANKTWRGLFSAVLLSTVIVYLQKLFYQNSYGKFLSVIDYSQTDIFVFGFLMGFGVILADAIKSFFKRRINVQPGDKWFPWDQLDFSGGLVLASLIYFPGWEIIFLALIISPLLPLVANKTAFALGLKKVAW